MMRFSNNNNNNNNNNKKEREKEDLTTLEMSHDVYQGAQQQWFESLTLTVTWHVSEYEVQKKKKKKNPPKAHP